MDWTLDDFIKFNNLLWMKDENWIQKELTKRFPDFHEMELDVDTKAVYIYHLHRAEGEESRMIEVIRYEYESDKYYVRYYSMELTKLTDLAVAEQRMLKHIMKLYVTACRVKGRAV